MNLRTIARSSACAFLAVTIASGPATAAPPAAPASSTVVTVPGGTNVSVSVTEPLSSANAAVGDHVALLVRKEIDIDGWVAIAQGANGQGTVITAAHAGGNGHGGKLAVHIDCVYAADGQKVALSNVDHPNLSSDNKGAASTATIVDTAILSVVGLGIVGLFAHNWVRGKDVVLDPKTVYPEFVDQTIRIVTSAKATVARDPAP
jgi:hypothetical protein